MDSVIYISIFPLNQWTSNIRVMIPHVCSHWTEIAQHKVLWSLLKPLFNLHLVSQRVMCKVQELTATNQNIFFNSVYAKNLKAKILLVVVGHCAMCWIIKIKRSTGGTNGQQATIPEKELTFQPACRIIQYPEHYMLTLSNSWTTSSGEPQLLINLINNSLNPPPSTFLASP